MPLVLQQLGLLLDVETETIIVMRAFAAVSDALRAAGAVERLRELGSHSSVEVSTLCT